MMICHKKSCDGYDSSMKGNCSIHKSGSNLLWCRLFEPASLTWRDRCRPLIARVIREHEGEEIRVVRKALREAYPWGQRSLHPYKIWCSEVRRQLGIDPDPASDPNQLQLF